MKIKSAPYDSHILLHIVISSVFSAMALHSFDTTQNIDSTEQVDLIALLANSYSDFDAI